MNSFVVNVRLFIRPYQHHLLMKAFKYAQIVYNRLLAIEKKKLVLFDNLEPVKELKDKLSKVKDKTKKKAIQKSLSYYRKQCNLTRFEIIKDVKELYKPYKAFISSQMAQSIAKRVDSAVSRYIEEPDVELKNIRQVHSIESESITNGIKFDGTNVIYNNMSLPILVKKDNYFNEAIKTCDLKYIRIVQRLGKTKTYYVAQMVFLGEPISKKKIELGDGDVGIDMGTSTITYSSSKEVRIEELSKELIKTSEEVSKINIKMDASRRVNNPDNFNDDGTCKKKEEQKPWKNSKNYLRLRKKRRYLSNKFSNQRKNLYEHQVNHLLRLGNRFIIEPMEYKALQRRAKETLKDEKGRFKKKRRFGKSLGEHAPSMFIDILSRKLGYLGLSLLKVNINTFKASQYNHVRDEYIKCDLNTRIKNIGGYEVQRDLYSAFLLMNAKDDLQTTDKEKCRDRFSKFLSLHSIEVTRLKTQNNISCIGY